VVKVLFVATKLIGVSIVSVECISNRLSEPIDIAPKTKKPRPGLLRLGSVLADAADAGEA
jgi:hypothetical protein